MGAPWLRCPRHQYKAVEQAHTKQCKLERAQMISPGPGHAPMSPRLDADAGKAKMHTNTGHVCAFPVLLRAASPQSSHPGVKTDVMMSLNPCPPCSPAGNLDPGNASYVAERLMTCRFRPAPEPAAAARQRPVRGGSACLCAHEAHLRPPCMLAHQLCLQNKYFV